MKSISFFMRFCTRFLGVKFALLLIIYQFYAPNYGVAQENANWAGTFNGDFSDLVYGVCNRTDGNAGVILAGTSITTQNGDVCFTQNDGGWDNRIITVTAPAATFANIVTTNPYVYNYFNATRLFSDDLQHWALDVVPENGVAGSYVVLAETYNFNDDFTVNANNTAINSIGNDNPNRWDIWAYRTNGTGQPLLFGQDGQNFRPTSIIPDPTPTNPNGYLIAGFTYARPANQSPSIGGNCDANAASPATFIDKRNTMETFVSTRIGNFFVLRVDANLQPVGTPFIYNNLTGRCHKIVALANGGFALIGSSTASPANSDYVLAILDNNLVLNANAVYTYGGLMNFGFDYAYSGVLLSDNNLLIVGRSNSGVGGQKTEASRGGSDFWILKINLTDQTLPLGSIIWQKTLGGSENEVATCVSINPNNVNQVFIGGTTTSNTNLPDRDVHAPRIGAVGVDSDGWVVCLNHVAASLPDANGVICSPYDIPNPSRDFIVWDQRFENTVGGLPNGVPRTDRVWAMAGNTFAGYSIANADAWVVNFNMTPPNLPQFLPTTVNGQASGASIQICLGQSISLTAANASGGHPLFSWSSPQDLPDIPLATGASVTVSPTVTTTYTITTSFGQTGTESPLTAIDCGNATIVIVEVTQPVTIVASTDAETICVNKCAQVTASGADSYVWQPGGLTDATVDVCPTQTTTYTVTGTTDGCIGSTQITINVLPTPSVSIVADNPIICAGACTDLTASGANSYVWQPGGLTGETVTVCPAQTTTYTVTGTTDGCSALAQITVTVPIVTISASVNPTSVCDGSCTDLSASGANTYVWQPVGLTGATVNVCPEQTTTYTVTGTDANGCTGVQILRVTVNSVPVTTVSAAATVICQGESTTLSALGADFYIWQPTNQTDAGIWVSPTQTTTYTVTGTNANGCTSTATVEITVNPLPTILPNPTSRTICLGETADLAVSGTATDYQWSPATGLDAITGALVHATPTQNQVYTITGVDNGTGCSATSQVSITVLQPTVLAVIGTVSPCPGAQVSVSINNPPVGLTNIVWYDVSNPTTPVQIGGTILIVSPEIPTTYSVSGLTPGPNGTPCRAHGQATIVVPQVIMPANTFFCSDFCNPTSNPVTLTAQMQGFPAGAEYTWLPANEILTQNDADYASTVTVAPTFSATYTLTVSYNGCEITGTVNVSQAPPALLSFDPPSLTAQTGMQTVTITNTSPATLSGYQWTPTTGLTFSSDNSTVTVNTGLLPNLTTVYTITAIPANGQTGCQLTTTFMVNNRCQTVPQTPPNQIPIYPYEICGVAPLSTQNFYDLAPTYNKPNPVVYTPANGLSYRRIVKNSSQSALPTFVLNQSLVIDKNLYLDNCILLMAPGTQITINDGFSLVLDGVQIRCSDEHYTWKGIRMKSGHLDLVGKSDKRTIIEGAEIGVLCQDAVTPVVTPPNKPKLPFIQVEKLTTFNRNRRHIVLYNITSPDLIANGLQPITFEGVSALGNQIILSCTSPLNGSLTNEKTEIGVLVANVNQNLELVTSNGNTSKAQIIDACAGIVSYQTPEYSATFSPRTTTINGWDIKNANFGMALYNNLPNTITSGGLLYLVGKNSTPKKENTLSTVDVGIHVQSARTTIENNILKNVGLSGIHVTNQRGGGPLIQYNQINWGPVLTPAVLTRLNRNGIWVDNSIVGDATNILQVLANSVQQCSQGVRVENVCGSIQIDDNDFIGTTAAHNGVYCANNYACVGKEDAGLGISISNNKFNDTYSFKFNEAITCAENPDSYLKIEGNGINRCESGINVSNVSLPTPWHAGGSEIQISSNVITGIGSFGNIPGQSFGIRVNSQYGTIDNNEIYFRDPAAPTPPNGVTIPYFGISIDGSKNIKVVNNMLDQNGVTRPGLTNYYGVHLQQSSDLTLCGNEMIELNRGVNVEGPNISTKLKNNFFNDNYTGLYLGSNLVGGAVLGNQYETNTTTGAITVFDNVWTNIANNPAANKPRWHTYSYFSNGLQTNFKVRNGNAGGGKTYQPIENGVTSNLGIGNPNGLTQPPQVPINYFVSSAQILVPSSINGLPANRTPIDCEILLPQGANPGIAPNPLLVQIAQNAFVSPVYPEPHRRLARKNLFARLQVDSALLASHPAFPAFQAVEALDANATLTFVENLIATNDWELARAINETVAPACQMRACHKMVNDIYIAFRLGGRDSLTADRIAALRTIAEVCPHIGGTAVHQARSFLVLVDDTLRTNYPNTCNPNAQARLGKDNTGALMETTALVVNEPLYLKIYPNPAQNVVTLDYASPENADKRVELFNLQGQRVLSYNLENATVGRVEIATDQLPNGIYLCQFTVGGRTVSTQKLLIVR